MADNTQFDSDGYYDEQEVSSDEIDLSFLDDDETKK